MKKFIFSLFLLTAIACNPNKSDDMTSKNTEDTSTKPGGIVFLRTRQLDSERIFTWKKSAVNSGSIREVAKY